MATLNIYTQLHDSILLTQRKMRAIRMLLPSDLSPVESIILSHLAYDTNRSASDLVNLLGISKSKISRLLNQLVSMGCLSMETTFEDKRGRRLVFTEYGTKLLTEADQLNSRISQLGCSLLSPREHLRMVELFRKLNNGLKAPPEKLREGEGLFAPEQRRAVIALGMLGESYMGNEFNLTQFQILNDIAKSKSGIGFKDLDDNLPFSTSKISRYLSDFENNNIISKFSPKGDKRQKIYSLTNNGLSIYNNLIEIFSDKLANAAENFTTDEVEELTSLLLLINKAPMPDIKNTGFMLRKCETSDMFFRAREYLVEKLVTEGRHKMLDQFIIPDSSICHLAIWNDKILALLEFRLDKKVPLIHNFLIDRKVLNYNDEINILREGIANITKTKKNTKILIPYSTVREGMISEKVLEQLSADSYTITDL